MKRIHLLFRLLQINLILAKYGLDQIILNLHLFSPVRFLIYLNPWNWFRSKHISRGESLRLAFEELGPIFVKFGQLLSTRPDIFPEDILSQLCRLQDQVPPFPSQMVIEIIENTYKKPIHDLFLAFDDVPLASASMAQVHSATLFSNEAVVVKVLRPQLKKIISNDVDILRSIAQLAEKYWPECRRFKPIEMVAEFERTLLDELDLQREAANASQLRRNFKHSPLLYIPTIYWEYTRTNILVMERIYGTPMTDLPTLRAAGTNMKKLAENGLTIFFTQVFRDCFFHADMHPGNIFISPQHPENPQYIFVDFGIVGSLNDSDKRYLAENLLAFFHRDYHRVAQLHIESGWISRTTRIDEFESAIRTVCEPIFEKPLKDISFATLVLRLLQVARRFEMNIQPQLILLQKTLLAIEGLGRQLDPDLDLWATAKPFLEKWVRSQTGPKAFFTHLRDNIPFFVEQLPHMPQLLFDVLSLQKTHMLQDTAPSEKANKKVSPYLFHYGVLFGITFTLLASSFMIHFFH